MYIIVETLTYNCSATMFCTVTSLLVRALGARRPSPVTFDLNKRVGSGCGRQKVRKCVESEYGSAQCENVEVTNTASCD